MQQSISEWKDITREFDPIDSLSLKDIDVAMKRFWADGSVGSQHYERHVMHLAHGYSHAINVANLAREIAEKTGSENPKNAFVAGLLHDIYRPIETGEGTEEHGEYCAQVAETVLKTSGFKKEIVMAIKQAIDIHDLSEEKLICKPNSEHALNKLLEQDLSIILFLADKSHMNMERVMAYAFDSQKYASDPETPKKKAKKLNWYKPRGQLGAVDIALCFVAKKFWRDTRIAVEIQSERSEFRQYCRKVFDAWENTVDELQSQARKEQRGEDSSKTLMLFWAFKEAISNFRYLAKSEDCLYDRHGKALWKFLGKVIGRYEELFLTQLEIEPFGYILEYRRAMGK